MSLRREREHVSRPLPSFRSRSPRSDRRLRRSRNEQLQTSSPIWLASLAGNFLLCFDFYLFDHPLERVAALGTLSESRRKSTSQRLVSHLYLAKAGPSWHKMFAFGQRPLRNGSTGGMVGSLSASGGASATRFCGKPLLTVLINPWTAGPGYSLAGKQREFDNERRRTSGRRQAAETFRRQELAEGHRADIPYRGRAASIVRRPRRGLGGAAAGPVRP